MSENGKIECTEGATTDLFGNVRLLALSWKQPFAAAMLAGKVETRVWRTKYRGPVLICASLTGYSYKGAMEISGEYQYQRMMTEMCDPCSPAFNGRRILGMAMAIGTLIDCREMRPEDEDATFVKYRRPWMEERVGKDGRVRKLSRRLYCHVYKDVNPIEPFIWRGSQGWSEVDPIVVEMIKKIGHSTKLPQ